MTNTKRNTRLMAKVRAAFILQGTTFHAYCLDNNIDPSYAARAVKGLVTAEGAKKLKDQIVHASNGKTAKPEQSMTA